MIAPRMAVATSLEHLTPRPMCPLESPMAEEDQENHYQKLKDGTLNTDLSSDQDRVIVRNTVLRALYSGTMLKLYELKNKYFNPVI
jgi:hypothetical protein